MSSAITKKPPAIHAAPPTSSAGEFGKGRRLHLSDPEFASELAEMKERIKNDRAYALDLFNKAGILNKRGKLTKEYGG